MGTAPGNVDTVASPYSQIPSELVRMLAGKIVFDAILRIACAATIRDPFEQTNMSVYYLTLCSFIVMTLESLGEAFYFRTVHEEAEWIIMAAYGRHISVFFYFIDIF